MENKRCGFCGRPFNGRSFLDPKDFEGIDLPLDYCPDAHYEDDSCQEPRRVTKDMATDAGDPSLEGMLI